MNTAYIYAADCYCPSCGERIQEQIDKAGALTDDQKEDSDNYPVAVVSDGETDTPQHCGEGENCLEAIELSDGTKVGAILEGTLTEDGEQYVLEAWKENPNSGVVTLWCNYYEIDPLEDFRDSLEGELDLLESEAYEDNSLPYTDATEETLDDAVWNFRRSIERRQENDELELYKSFKNVTIQNKVLGLWLEFCMLNGHASHYWGKYSQTKELQFAS